MQRSRISFGAKLIEDSEKALRGPSPYLTKLPYYFS